MSSVRGPVVEAGFRLALTVVLLPSECQASSSFPWDAVKFISVGVPSATIVVGRIVGTRGTPLLKTDFSTDSAFTLASPGADPVATAASAADCNADAVLCSRILA
ncbi:hypothetical protein MTO96_052329 [Rhipicephalus appendiculatus]